MLTLTNSTGTIDSSPIWSERLDWAAGADKGKVVQVVGDISSFGSEGAKKRQLDLTAPLRVLPAEEFNPTDFLPRVDVDIVRLWDTIDKLRQGMAPSIRRAVDLFFADDAFRVQFERSPGSVNGHHAQLGGLLLHVCEVANIARSIARTVRAANVDLTVAGALLHDIGKVEAYAVAPEGFTHTATGTLLGHVTLGALMFDRKLNAAGGADLTAAQRDEMLHFILSHHGSLEFGSPVQPMTLEAEILHWADEASAKATDMVDEFADPELFPPGSSAELSAKRSWRLGRKLWRRPQGWE